MVKRKRIKRNSEDLKQELKNQIELMKLSSEAYDSGTEAAAKLLSLNIRVLLHHHGSSISLLQQLRLREKIKYLDTSKHIYDVMLSSYSGLTNMQKDSHEAPWKYVPLYDFMRKELKVPEKISFPKWWNQVVIIDNEDRNFNRREIILNVANTDGGAHVDPALEEAYMALSRQNSLGWVIQEKGKFVPVKNKAELATVRQIAYELLLSFKEQLPEFYG